MFLVNPLVIRLDDEPRPPEGYARIPRGHGWERTGGPVL